MDEELVTEEEIKEIKSNPIVYSAMEILAKKKVEIIKPVKLKSGYSIGYSIDEFHREKFEHISIYRYKNEKNVEKEEQIAEKILGKGVIWLGCFSRSDVVHFMKEIKDESLDKKEKI